MDLISHRTFKITLASAVSGVSHTLINTEFWQLLSSHPDLLTPLLATARYMQNVPMNTLSCIKHSERTRKWKYFLFGL